ncbi:hypothetical protein AZI87_04740 [Bdellovibrio bacteriovorus]|uniref:Uncharacterized protein n=1 Tax=Bdellovibrio bacteriovorus TaxID=959 RepID=A0A162GN96_BDEBC|nr:hypothetical protein AZI87_04740 [Bdellovibrio bacteriovorus]
MDTCMPRKEDELENNLDKNLSVILVKLARPFLAIGFIATAVLLLISIKFTFKQGRKISFLGFQLWLFAYLGFGF